MERIWFLPPDRANVHLGAATNILVLAARATNKSSSSYALHTSEFAKISIYHGSVDPSARVWSGWIRDRAAP